MFRESIVMVTGAGRAIGKEIALKFASAGADIVLAARSVEAMEAVAAEVRHLGSRALVLPMDLKNGQEVEAGTEAAIQEFGGIDVLVNNSGIGGPTEPLHRIDADDWEETLQVNLTGAFLATKAVLPSMIDAKRGSIIFIGSVTGKRPLVNRASYAASKLGMVGMVRTLAMEVGQHGIRVNLVSPGAVSGERMDWVVDQQAEALGVSREEVLKEVTSTAALRRFVSPTDVANAVIFLASDNASGITGEDLNVNAGMVMY